MNYFIHKYNLTSKASGCFAPLLSALDAMHKSQFLIGLWISSAAAEPTWFHGQWSFDCEATRHHWVAEKDDSLTMKSWMETVEKYLPKDCGSESGGMYITDSEIFTEEILRSTTRREYVVVQQNEKVLKIEVEDGRYKQPVVVKQTSTGFCWSPSNPGSNELEFVELATFCFKQ